jgi:4-amino-4-deoxy-L-arabinose transferase-like glycosyltransferase
MHTLTKPFILLLALICIGFWAFNLDSRKLAKPDEGRYAEISREMAVSGNFITPRLNDLKYFEKPPLQYWATALAFKTFGTSEWTARLWTTLCALIMLAITAYTALQFFGRDTAIATAAVLMSSWYTMALAQINSLDMGLSCWLTVCWCAFMLALREEKTHRGWFVAAWAAAALAVLSKGLIGVVFPGAVLFFYCVVARNISSMTKVGVTGWVLGLIVFFVITAPWFILVSQDNAEFARFFFIHEHFERFTSKSHRRVEAWWYFLPIVFTGFGVWALALWPAVLSAVRQSPKMQYPNALINPLGFALAWSVFIVAFFSASGSKLPAYVLPVFPALALLMGHWLTHTSIAKWWPIVIAGALLGSAVCAFALLWPDIAARKQRTEDMVALYKLASPWIAVAGALLVAAALSAPLVAKRVSKNAGLLMSGLLSLLAFQFAIHGYEQLSPTQSSANVAAAIKPYLTASTKIYSVRIYDQPLTFYLQRPVILVDYIDEFETGLKTEPHKSITNTDDFLRRWRAEPGAVAIIHPEFIKTMRESGASFTVLFEDSRRIVVSSK